MTGVLFVAALGLLVGSGIAYFRIHFRTAAGTAFLFWACMTYVILHTMPAMAAWFALSVLCFGPMIFFTVHLIDARTGTFIFPTAYSIAVGYVTGVLLWIVAGIGLLL